MDESGLSPKVNKVSREVLETLTSLSAWWWPGFDNIEFVSHWTTSFSLSLPLV